MTLPLGTLPSNICSTPPLTLTVGPNGSLSFALSGTPDVQLSAVQISLPNVKVKASPILLAILVTIAAAGAPGGGLLAALLALGEGAAGLGSEFIDSVKNLVNSVGGGISNAGNAAGDFFSKLGHGVGLSAPVGHTPPGLAGTGGTIALGASALLDLLEIDLGTIQIAGAPSSAAAPPIGVKINLDNISVSGSIPGLTAALQGCLNLT